MKTKVIAIVFVVIGLFSTSYLSWALHRTTAKVLIYDRQWPRHWPYPDEWILNWNNELELAHPAQWGVMKMRGELPRIQLYLSGFIVLTLLVMLVGLVWLAVLQRKKVLTK